MKDVNKGNLGGRITAGFCIISLHMYFLNIYNEKVEIVIDRSGCCNKILQMGWLTNNRNCLLSVLTAGSLGSGAAVVG